MKKFITTRTGRLRILAFLEGISLLILVFIAVPVKYIMHNPAMVKAIGPVHGMLFILFMINVFSVAVEQRWSFTSTTWKVMVASFIPFGTFYIDHTILRKLQMRE